MTTMAPRLPIRHNDLAAWHLGLVALAISSVIAQIAPLVVWSGLWSSNSSTSFDDIGVSYMAFAQPMHIATAVLIALGGWSVGRRITGTRGQLVMGSTVVLLLLSIASGILGPYHFQNRAHDPEWIGTLGTAMEYARALSWLVLGGALASASWRRSSMRAAAIALIIVIAINERVPAYQAQIQRWLYHAGSPIVIGAIQLAIHLIMVMLLWLVARAALGEANTPAFVDESRNDRVMRAFARAEKVFVARVVVGLSSVVLTMTGGISSTARWIGPAAFALTAWLAVEMAITTSFVGAATPYQSTLPRRRLLFAVFATTWSLGAAYIAGPDERFHWLSIAIAGLAASGLIAWTSAIYSIDEVMDTDPDLLARVPRRHRRDRRTGSVIIGGIVATIAAAWSMPMANALLTAVMIAVALLCNGVVATMREASAALPTATARIAS